MQVIVILSSTCWVTTAGRSSLISKAAQTFCMKLSLKFAARLFLCDVSSFCRVSEPHECRRTFRRKKRGNFYRRLNGFSLFLVCLKNIFIINVCLNACLVNILTTSDFVHYCV